MKVLFLLDTLSPGGTETSTVQLAGQLKTLDVESVIVALERREHDLDEDARLRGVRVLSLRRTSTVGRLSELRRLIKFEQPDVLHTALFRADQLGRLASIKLDVRVVSSFVSTPYDRARLGDPNVTRWKLRIVQFIDALTSRLFVDRFHSVSQGAKDENAAALRLSRRRIDVVDRGRDVEHLGPANTCRRSAVRAELGIDEEQPVLLSLGRHEHQKAQVDLVEAARLLSSASPDLRVLIAGKSGSATSRLNAAVNCDPWTTRAVHLLGHRRDVGDLLVAADLLVISSHYEGTAGVAIEAMSVGVPIVSTDTAGLRGVLSDGVNAVLVPPAEPAALARGIDRVLSDRELAARLVERGHVDFESRFTLDAAAEGMKRFYTSVIGLK